MVHHSSKLHSLDGSPEVFQLNLVLVTNISLGKNVLVNLTLNGFWLQVFNFIVMVMYVDPI